MIKIESVPSESRVCQGDIIAEVEFVEYALEKSGEIEISKIIFPYIYVLSQDCDLKQDYSSRNNDQSKNDDKHLISVMVAPLYNIQHFYAGQHLADIGLTMQTINSNESKTENKTLRQNNNPRYQYMEFPQDIAIPPSVIDFKHYFTVNSKYLLERKSNFFVCKVGELYRENISHRFAYFLSRIGLPDT